MLSPERARRIEALRPRRADLLLLHEAVELLLQVGRLDPGVVSVSLSSRPMRSESRATADDVGHVVAVGVALLVLLAALRPEQEQDDDQDRERDQAEQAQERREARARPDRAARRPGTAAAAAEGAAQGAVAATGAS